MKKILIALALVFAVQATNAQVKTPEVAKKALDGAVAASQDAKKAAKVATWLKLATAYMDAYNAPAGAVWLGASKQELQLIMANEKPISVEQVSLGGEPCQKEVYRNKELFFNQNGFAPAPGSCYGSGDPGNTGTYNCNIIFFFKTIFFHLIS